MSEILLIRHGESQSNRGLATSSPDVVKLTDIGHKQAGAIAHFLKTAPIQPDLIIYSSFLRTWQTAKPTLAAFPHVPHAEWPVQEFTYLSMWHHENSTVEDRRQWVDTYWELSDPLLVSEPKYGMPQVESFEQFIGRVRAVRKKLENLDSGIIIIFTHEQFMTAFQQFSDSKPITRETMKEFRVSLKSHPIENGAIVKGKYSRASDKWSYEPPVSVWSQNPISQKHECLTLHRQNQYK